MDRLSAAVREIINQSAGEIPYQQILDAVVEQAGGQGGTIHVLDPDACALRLAAWTQTIPEPVLAAVRTVPVGKGMAGVAAQRRAPVTTCDLQSDNAGGVARPGAKQTGFRGSICVPAIASSGELAGTLGVGCAETREFSEAQVRALLDAAGALADAILHARRA